MNQLDNPYASALDGLIIEDPVIAFFNFWKKQLSIVGLFARIGLSIIVFFIDLARKADRFRTII